MVVREIKIIKQSTQMVDLILRDRRHKGEKMEHHDLGLVRRFTVDLSGLTADQSARLKADVITEWREAIAEDRPMVVSDRVSWEPAPPRQDGLTKRAWANIHKHIDDHIGSMKRNDVERIANLEDAQSRTAGRITALDQKVMNATENLHGDLIELGERVHKLGIETARRFTAVAVGVREGLGLLPDDMP